MVDRMMQTPAQAVVDLSAIRHNITLLRREAAGAQLMAVVKADAYGHGMVPCAVAALEAGADCLGGGDRPCRRAGRSAGPAPPEGRHWLGPRRGTRQRVASCRGGCPCRAGRRLPRDHWALVTFRLCRRAGPPVDPRPARRLYRGS